MIERLEALEILDSRGRPTLEVTCRLASGAVAKAQVPSGASTGTSEALELRDGDPQRHRGLGCRRAVGNVTGALASAICGEAFDHQELLDRVLIELDGTPHKSRLGANAILGVSLAFARATAKECGVPLYAHFAELIGDRPRSLPLMAINLFSGGKHAGGQVPIQDVLIVPAAARSIDEGLVTACAVAQSAAELIERKYGMRRLTADEGGLAPPFTSIEGMFDDAITSIERAGYQPGKEVALAVDAASSHFFEDGTYRLGDIPLTADAMIDEICRWVDQYPILSVEDGLAEDDWPHWPLLHARLAGRSLTLGDDLLCTNPDRIRRAIDGGACDALLLKVNQIGTLSEAAEARRLARAAGWRLTISARSGETEDDWLADLAVGWGGDFIKVGSVTQSDRLAKYNRLLAIEAETRLPVARGI
ncbi:MAG: phosphopyruvate hydratase [Planctomycetaceae bacterium]